MLWLIEVHLPARRRKHSRVHTSRRTANGMFVVLHLLGSSADRRLSALSCSIPLLLVLSTSELASAETACLILLFLGDGYLPVVRWACAPGKGSG
jgi:hypothetical protein